ncbi:alpha/beta hydrolase [Thalassobaculum fulvum]|uniref:Alpha/beta hydrolase n=1 Tax=Thalassobaculum fulvum TaxID=1633335 RepID=A0A918XQ83_9PROT|nr:alpha/beta hydrolase [Thalassobaculum fulvum]GHD46584.1 alpha/beta hydrolase [Thalassobaculum fulvum]
MGIVTGMAMTAAAGWVLVVTVLYATQRSILFVPDTSRPDPAASAAPMMARVTTVTADGLELEGWWQPPAAGRPTVLYFHGNGGNVGGRDDKARRMIERGYGVLLAGYRGYGGNPGSPSEAGLIDDGRAWLDRVEGFGIAARATVLYGESLGSGVVAALALERAVAGLVLEAPYTSIADIAAARYWFVPARRLVRDPFDTRSRLGGAKAPVLIVHGTEDRVVPIDHGEALFEVAPEPKRLVRLRGGAHTDLFDHGALEALDAFVAEVIAAGRWPAAAL